jgi:hypothetical protein
MNTARAVSWDRERHHRDTLAERVTHFVARIGS